MADEVAELAVKLLRPPQAEIAEATRIDDMAFLVCVRLGLIQARKWELFGDAPIYESPAKDNEQPLMFDVALEKLVAKMKTSGHILERASWGGFLGLECNQCNAFHNDAEFGKCRKTCVPKPISRQLLQHQQER